MPMFWVLDENNNHVGTDDVELFGAFFKNTKNRVVGRTEIGSVEAGIVAFVSTVFLCMDYGFGYTDKPWLYETMCFGAGMENADDFSCRYTTRKLAIEGHARIVKAALEYLSDRNLGEVG